MDENKQAVVVRTDPKVEQAVAWLWLKKQEMEGELTLRAREIGDYIIRTFFDDDLAEVTSQNPLKNVSFQKLCDRADLPFNASTMRRFMQVAINFRCMPAEKAKELPPSHHSVLYQVADPDERCRIGCEAATKNVSVRLLREMVRGKGRRRPGAGRPASSRFAKDWRQLIQTIESLAATVEGEGIDETDLREELRRETRVVRDQLNRIIDRLSDLPRQNIDE